MGLADGVPLCALPENCELGAMAGSGREENERLQHKKTVERSQPATVRASGQSAQTFKRGKALVAKQSS